MAILKMRAYSYSENKAAIFERKGAGFTSYGVGFDGDINKENSSSEELLRVVLKLDPKFEHCAERQLALMPS